MKITIFYFQKIVAKVVCNMVELKIAYTKLPWAKK